MPLEHLNPSQPVVILDVDEVLLDFSSGLRKFLSALDVRVVDMIYELEGRAEHASTGVELTETELDDLVRRFYSERSRTLSPIPGGAESVARISNSAQVIVLTNSPGDLVEDRVFNLREAGIDVPVFTNIGGKGRFVANIEREVTGAVVFIDDAMKQIDSVRKHSSNVFCIHFAVQEYVREKYGSRGRADAQVFSWAECERVVLGVLNRNEEGG